jgi:hypothetical protein
MNSLYTVWKKEYNETSDDEAKGIVLALSFYTGLI